MKKTVLFSVCAFALVSIGMSESYAQHLVTGNLKTTIKAMLRQADAKDRGPHGRAFILTNKEVPLQVSSGKCHVVGPGNPGVEFDVESSTFDSFYSRAYFAYENKKTIFIRYDNSFGSEQNCKLTSIEIVN